MNELEFQIKQIKQAIQMGSPMGLVLGLLEILEEYVADENTTQQGALVCDGHAEIE